MHASVVYGSSNVLLPSSPFLNKVPLFNGPSREALKVISPRKERVEEDENILLFHTHILHTHVRTWTIYVPERDLTLSSFSLDTCIHAYLTMGSLSLSVSQKALFLPHFYISVLMPRMKMRLTVDGDRGGGKR